MIKSWKLLDKSAISHNSQLEKKKQTTDKIQSQPAQNAQRSASGTAFKAPCRRELPAWAADGCWAGQGEYVNGVIIMCSTKMMNFWMNIYDDESDDKPIGIPKLYMSTLYMTNGKSKWIIFSHWFFGPIFGYPPFSSRLSSTMRSWFPKPRGSKGQGCQGCYLEATRRQAGRVRLVHSCAISMFVMKNSCS